MHLRNSIVIFHARIIIQSELSWNTFPYNVSWWEWRSKTWGEFIKFTWAEKQSHICSKEIQHKLINWRCLPSSPKSIISLREVDSRERRASLGASTFLMRVCCPSVLTSRVVSWASKSLRLPRKESWLFFSLSRNCGGNHHQYWKIMQREG